MVPRKGAFELSMGFIVTVVFAVVLLTLALLFLQGIFKGVDDQRERLEKLASEELEKAFAESDIGFNIYPENLDMKRNTIFSVTAGVKNNAADGESHSFAVNVVTQEVPPGVSKSSVQKWINFVSSPARISPEGNKKIPINIQIPENARAGQYFFDMVTCADITPDGNRVQVSSAGCTPNSENIWGSSAKTFVLTVTI